MVVGVRVVWSGGGGYGGDGNGGGANTAWCEMVVVMAVVVMVVWSGGIGGGGNGDGGRVRLDYCNVVLSVVMRWKWLRLLGSLFTFYKLVQVRLHWELQCCFNGKVFYSCKLRVYGYVYSRLLWNFKRAGLLIWLLTWLFTWLLTFVYKVYCYVKVWLWRCVQGEGHLQLLPKVYSWLHSCLRCYCFRGWTVRIAEWVYPVGFWIQPHKIKCQQILIVFSNCK